MKRLLFFALAWGMLSTLAAQSFADQSVLQSGQWYRLPITEAGVYSLDAAFFQGLGIDPGQIDPDKIHLHGRGGGMLPQANSAARPDDLPEIPIEVTGAADGSFNGNDRVLFYAEGAHTWRYLTESEQYQHEYHLYADTNYYFLRVGGEDGLRITEAAATTGTIAADKHREAYFHEVDRENILKSGRFWMGEKFDLTLSRTYAFPLHRADAGGTARIRLNVAARSDVQTSFLIKVGNQTVGSVSLSNVNIGNKEARQFWTRQGSFQLPLSGIANGDSLRITLEYQRNGSTRSEGWLDWLEVEYDAALHVDGRAQARFRVANNQISPGAGLDLSIGGMSTTTRLWDISDPLMIKALPFTLNGSTASAQVLADTTTLELIAVNTAKPYSGSAIPVANQNLHGLTLVDYLIISPEAFVAEANRLAAFHQSHYGRSTAVVTPQQIYNEFSGGMQDVSAIRDFIRMFWVRSGGISPGFVTLFGDGTYIYKYISQNVNNETNYLPTYQSRDSWEPTDSYVSDDFFVLLEEEEGMWGEGSDAPGDVSREVNTLDVAIGRLPIESVEQAQQIVDKIINYATNPDPEYFGDWRNRIVLVADHKEGEGNTHVRQANGYTSQINSANPCYNVDKVYMDNYQMVLSAGLTRFPEGREALLSAFDQGALILNYTGHGGEQAWSNSRILENSDILRLKNNFRTPAVVTATCEFGRYDDPTVRSGAEIMVMTPEVGAIALFTTVRLVYSSPNQTLNANFYREVFEFDSLAGRMPTMGEVMMRTKNRTFRSGALANINSRNFTLLGDPGLILNYPRYEAVITHINDEPIDAATDSLRSLGRVSVSGFIADQYGDSLRNFSGDMDITVFDKPSVFTTRLSNYTFSWQKNRIFNGRCTVNDGQFSFEFVVPIDISYEDGQGKFSLYFHNDSIDGAGCYENLYVGGTDPDATIDNTGPQVELYLNDEQWIDGGITGPEPFLYARLFDENGINTVGSGIGHEIVATLDDDASRVFNLNAFYEADQDDFRSGSVRYRLRDLELGEHRLHLRVWDIANNASEAETWFIVTDNASMALEQILNYPNPVVEETNFLVSHNQDGAQLSLTVDIISAEGRMVRRLQRDFVATGNVNRDLQWDGTDANGRPISDGMYVYRVRLQNVETGEEVFATKRLVLVKPLD